MTAHLPWFIQSPLGALKAYLRRDNYVVVDFEGTNLDKGSALNSSNHIILACWYVVKDGKILKRHKFADEYDLAELEKDIKAAAFVVAHNAKFECQWFARMGIDLRNVLMFDTFLAEWVILSNRTRSMRDLGLDATATRYGLAGKTHVTADLIHAGVCPSTIPTAWLRDYCFDDVDLTNQVFLKQIDILERDGLLHLVLVRNLTVTCLADIEANGCHLDPDAVRKEYEETTAQLDETSRALRKIVGDINLRSSAVKIDLLYGRLGFTPPLDPRTKKPFMTKSGALSTDAEVLSKLVAKTEEQREFLLLFKKINRLHALLSKNLLFFLGTVEDYGGVFFGVLNQGSTKTGRLSSSGKPLLFKNEKKPRGAQLQNQPRAYKKLFMAFGDDWLVGEADGAQLEFRVGADLSHDVVATKEIEEGVDIHSFTAQVLIDAREEGFAGLSIKEARQGAKPQTFAPMYGSGGKTPATRKYAEFFRSKYADLFRTQTDWTREVLRTGKLRTPYGMVFYWPGTKMKPSGYIDNTTSIFNYPIQGFATGEIMPIALFHFWHKTKDLPIIIWNTVHDSIVSRVHTSAIDEYERLSKECLTKDVFVFLQDVYKYTFVVPLGVGVKVSKNWGKSDVEKVWSVWPDGRETYVEK